MFYQEFLIRLLEKVLPCGLVRWHLLDFYLLHCKNISLPLAIAPLNAR
jgi:hypothetical protein